MTAPDYRLTSSRYGVKLHTTTCKKAKAGTPVELADINPQDIPPSATCCKPAQPKATAIAKARAGRRKSFAGTAKPKTGSAKKATGTVTAIGDAKSAKKAKRAPTEPVTVRLCHDGKAMPDSQNKLSSVAYYYTARIVDGEPRQSTSWLRDTLRDAGIATPEQTPGWSHTLPNGIVLSSVALALTGQG